MAMLLKSRLLETRVTGLDALNRWNKVASVYGDKLRKAGVIDAAGFIDLKKFKRLERSDPETARAILSALGDGDLTLGRAVLKKVARMQGQLAASSSAKAFKLAESNVEALSSLADQLAARFARGSATYLAYKYMNNPAFREKVAKHAAALVESSDKLAALRGTDPDTIVQAALIAKSLTMAGRGAAVDRLKSAFFRGLRGAAVGASYTMGMTAMMTFHYITTVMMAMDPSLLQATMQVYYGVESTLERMKRLNAMYVHQAMHQAGRTG